MRRFASCSPLKMVTTLNYHIGILGAGAWGTALAKLLGEKGFPVSLWVHDPGLAEEMARTRLNRPYLPGVRIPRQVLPTGSLQEAVAEKEAVIIVTPSHAFREVLSAGAVSLGQNARIVIATKGLEVDSLHRMSEVAKEILALKGGRSLAVFSGPSFAKEVARRLPTAVTLASEQGQLALELQGLFAASYFRVYTSHDVIGVELGGALKNVIAIAVGAAVGLKLGHNSQAALITRGIAEMTRLAVKMGANPLTMAGLSGLGDLVLTATSPLSRNRTLGVKLGQGKKLEEILRQTLTVAEGVNTAKAVFRLSRQLKVEMPISDQVYYMLYEGLPPSEAVATLMARGQKEEIQF